MSDPRLDSARHNLMNAFHSTKSSVPTVHSVTFQPFDPNCNADRIAVKRFNILGQFWLFLLLCDGHGGTRTSEYTVEILPLHIAATLEATIRHRLGGRVDRTNLEQAKPLIDVMLKHEVVRFDQIIGKGVTDVCPEPSKLTKEDALRLIEEQDEVLARAFQGTTVSMAIVNMDEHFMWAAGVGDSTIALSTVDSTGVRRAERLCEIHNFKNQQEYFRVLMSHPSTEKNIVNANSRLLGWLDMSRAIGGFPLKMDPGYLRHLFQYISINGSSFSQLLDRVLTPPYVIAEPSVRCVDLQPVWGNDPTLLLFSDGVDLIVDGYYAFTPRVHSGVGALDIIPALLPNNVNPPADNILGHQTEPGWSRSKQNLAIDVLGNLLGGTNPERLEMVLDRQLLRAPDSIFHIDDTTLIVARLTG